MKKIILLTLITVFAMTNLSAQKRYAYDPNMGVFAGSDNLRAI